MKLTELHSLCCLIDREFKGTWEWLWTIMECTESQLRFGTSLSAASDLSRPGHPMNEGQGKTGASKDKRGSEQGISVDKKARLVVKLHLIISLCIHDCHSVSMKITLHP